MSVETAAKDWMSEYASETTTGKEEGMEGSRRI